MTDSFDPFTTVSWTHLTHLAMIEVILIGKCVYSQLARAVQTRKKIIYIEVRNYNDRLQRYMSKRNLNTVVETFQKKKNYALFDKFWYLKRAEGLADMEYAGLCVDEYSNVSHSLQMNHHLLQNGLLFMPRIGSNNLSSTASKRPTSVNQPSETGVKTKLDALFETESFARKNLNRGASMAIEMQQFNQSSSESKNAFQPEPLESPTLGMRTSSFMVEKASKTKQEKGFDK